MYIDVKTMKWAQTKMVMLVLRRNLSDIVKHACVQRASHVLWRKILLLGMVQVSYNVSNKDLNPRYNIKNKILFTFDVAEDIQKIR